MKKLYIGIVGYSKLWSRMMNMIETECLRTVDFNIVAYEDEAYISSYAYTTHTTAQWEKYVEHIKTGLIENLSRINNKKYDTNADYSWLNSRKLERGDLSVMAKHKRVMENFLEGKSDYVLVLEDDAVINKDALNKIRKLINTLPLDYLDIAGGDNIKTNQSKVEILESIGIEKIKNGATRTACAYILSRNAAEESLRILKYPCLPIDWSISVALSLNKDFNCYWMRDSLIQHGSCTGKVVSWRKS